MNLKQDQRWLTGAEIGQENRRLIAAGIPDDAPEFQQLIAHVMARDDALFERFGRPYLETHPGQWIAISLDGQVILRDTAGEVTWAAAEAFGDGNFCKRKLSPFPGHEVYS